VFQLTHFFVVAVPDAKLPDGMKTTDLAVAGDGPAVSAAPDTSIPKNGPLDITATVLLDTPVMGGPPKGNDKPSKRRRIMKKGQKVVRRARKAFLKPPVLVIILGRQLARPTSDALKILAKGGAVDVDEVLDHAGPADAAPLDAVPVPAPEPASAAPVPVPA